MGCSVGWNVDTIGPACRGYTNDCRLYRGIFWGVWRRVYWLGNEIWRGDGVGSLERTRRGAMLKGELLGGSFDTIQLKQI